MRNDTSRLQAQVGPGPRTLSDDRLHRIPDALHDVRTQERVGGRVRRRAGPSCASRARSATPGRPPGPRPGSPSSCTDLGNTTPVPPTPCHLIYFRFVPGYCESRRSLPVPTRSCFPRAGWAGVGKGGREGGGPLCTVVTLISKEPINTVSEPTPPRPAPPSSRPPAGCASSASLGVSPPEGRKWGGRAGAQPRGAPGSPRGPPPREQFPRFRLSLRTQPAGPAAGLTPEEFRSAAGCDARQGARQAAKKRR